jgi:hypothetical protein
MEAPTMLTRSLYSKKKIIRTITNTKPRDSCREAFKELEIMTFYSQNIYSFALYTENNKHLLDANNEILLWRYNPRGALASITGVPRGVVCGVQTPPPPRNSEVLKKPGQIPSSVEYNL